MNSKNDKLTAIIYRACIIFLILLIFQSLFYCHFGGIMHLRADYLINVSIDMAGLFLCVVLILSLANDKPWDRQNRAFFRLIFCLGLLMHSSITAMLLEGHPEKTAGLKLYNTLILILEVLLIFCFWIYVCEELHINRKTLPIIHVLCTATLTANVFFSLLNLKYGFFFIVDALGFCWYGKYKLLEELPAFLIYLAIWYVVLRDREHSVKDKSTLLSFQVIHVIAHVLVLSNHFYAVVYPAYLISMMMIYINIFAVRSRRILEQQVVLDRQKTALMISQIQPHFLYNVLTTISNLCATDPEEAEETTILFSQYLRTNIDSLRLSTPVLFKVELNHIRTYIELEKKRFGDKIQAEINCPETEFPVPSLGLQPIVENSIKHGIRGKDTPGHLTITSRRVKNGYEVVIEDDGVGFDPQTPKPDDGRSHVGMVNVKSRLEHMCHAEVTVISSPGNGCRTEIFFPDMEDLP